MTFIRSSGSHFCSPVFSAKIMGDKCIFLADPKLLMTVFKPKFKKYLDTFSLQKDFMQRVLNLTEDETEEVFGNPDVLRLGSQQYHHFLFKGEELERSVGRVHDFFHKNLPDLASSDNSTWTSHAMFAMVTKTVFKATMGPFLSDNIANDDAFEAFRTFDKEIVPLYNKAPAFLTKKSIEARSYLLTAVQSTSFWSQASPLMKKRQETLPLSPSAMSKANLGITFAAVGNSAPAIYWALLRLMQDPPAWNACLAQVEAVTARKGAGRADK